MDWQQLIAELKQIAKDKGISHYVIADKLGMKRPHITRFFAGRTCPRIDLVMKVAESIGVKITWL